MYGAGAPAGSIEYYQTWFISMQGDNFKADSTTSNSFRGNKNNPLFYDRV